MPLSKRDNYYYASTYSRSYRNTASYGQQYTQKPKTLAEVKQFRPKAKPKRKLNWKGKIVITAFLGLFVSTVTPFFINKITKPVLLMQTPNKNVKVDNYNYLYNPTLRYINNVEFLNKKMLIGASKKPSMQSIYLTEELTGLKAALQNQITAHPNLNPSIFVWDISNGKYVDIKGDTPYPAASIIKIPVLISMFKSIEAGKFNLKDSIPFEEPFRSHGSGSLQYKAGGINLTIDDYARLMITESDNSSTNILMSVIGSMDAVNSDIKKWGLKNTHIQTWLPDLGGTNYTTTKDLTIMLHNLDNEAFLTLESRASIFDYMGHVKNNRLLAAGIPPNASIAHKTGDIGEMLGDAGIIYAPNGRKYIVAIMVKRPHNDYSAKDFIVNASKTIYDYMTNYQ